MEYDFDWEYKKRAYCWNYNFPLMGLALRPDGDFK
jgi:hypothetical protein